jgi:hypothetical protein
MSFLDNLENNLKAMESLEASGLDDRKRRELERERSIASAPWAERLKKSPYVGKLMRDLTRAGFPRRMKMNFVWIGRALRIEAVDQRLELQPTPVAWMPCLRIAASDKPRCRAGLAHRGMAGSAGPPEE